jgi:hypothetical protein
VFCFCRPRIQLKEEGTIVKRFPATILEKQPETAFYFQPLKFKQFAMENQTPHKVPLQANSDEDERTSAPKRSVVGSKAGRSQPGNEVEFQPSEYSILCGRGKDSFNHVGNRRFRNLASMFVERYSRACTKAAKTGIVSEIMDVIRQADGNFCQFKMGVWIEVGDHHAREKVSALLRDFLHNEYRSSAKAKVARRKTKRTGNRKENQDQQAGQNLVDDTPHSDASLTSSCWGSTEDSLGFEYWLEDDFFDIDVF